MAKNHMPYLLRSAAAVAIASVFASPAMAEPLTNPPEALSAQPARSGAQATSTPTQASQHSIDPSPAPAGSGQVVTPGAPAGDTTTDSGSGDIIVTAQKRSERLNDVPLSITAASGAELQQRGVTNPAQLTKLVPSFTFQQSDFGVPVYGIRGVSFNSNSTLAVPAVSVYVDQIPLPLSILTLGSSLDVERVEVLKGPQGTLFGENATGGAVNFIAAKPTEEYVAGGNITVGRFGEVDADAYVGGQLAPGLTARVSGRVERRSDWQYSASRDDELGQRNFSALRTLLDFKPSSGIRFELNINGWVDRSDSEPPQFQRFFPSTPVGGYAPAYAALGPQPRIDGNARVTDFDPGRSYRSNDRFFQTSLRSEFDLTRTLELISLSSYIRFRGLTNTDNDGTPYSNVYVNRTERMDIFTQELRLEGSITRLKYMLGGFYEHDNLTEQVQALNEGTNSVLAGIHYDQYGITNHQPVSTKAVFGSLDLDLGHRITLQGSIRYTDENRKFSGCTFAPVGSLGTGSGQRLLPAVDDLQQNADDDRSRRVCDA